MQSMKSALLVSSDSSEQKGKHMTESNANLLQCPLNQQLSNSLDGPVAILWDIENCSVPHDVRPEDVAGNVRMALRRHPVIEGTVMMFSAYGDFNAFPRRLREGCQRTGVKLIDIPSGRKDAADKAILIDMFLFALDNRPPSSIMLISGDVDFSPALHILGQRGYSIILVIPAGVGISSALRNAGKFVWDWPSIARGEGFLLPSKAVVPPHVGPTEDAGYLIGCHIKDNPDGQNEEEAIAYRGISQNHHNSRVSSSVSQSLSEYNSGTLNVSCSPTALRSHSLPSTLNNVSGGPMSSSSDQNENRLCIQPGDLNGLEGQLVSLLKLSGGCLPLGHVPAEYQKYFGRPLCVSEYRIYKLEELFKKMGHTLAVEEKGSQKFVHLRNWKAGPSAPSLSQVGRDKKGKGVQHENVDIVTAGCSLTKLSDKERIIIEEHDERSSIAKGYQGKAASCEIDDSIIEQFNHKLQETQQKVELSKQCHEGHLKEKERLVRMMGNKEIYQERVLSRRQAEFNRIGREREERLSRILQSRRQEREKTRKLKFYLKLEEERQQKLHEEEESGKRGEAERLARERLAELEQRLRRREEEQEKERRKEARERLADLEERLRQREEEQEKERGKEVRERLADLEERLRQRETEAALKPSEPPRPLDTGRLKYVPKFRRERVEATAPRDTGKLKYVPRFRRERVEAAASPTQTDRWTYTFSK